MLPNAEEGNNTYEVNRTINTPEVAEAAAVPAARVWIACELQPVIMPFIIGGFLDCGEVSERACCCRYNSTIVRSATVRRQRDRRCLRGICAGLYAVNS